MEKYKAELRVRHVLRSHQCGFKHKENTTEVFFPISVHMAFKSRERGAPPPATARATHLL